VDVIASVTKAVTSVPVRLIMAMFPPTRQSRERPL
jgi:hypothetical protein